MTDYIKREDAIQAFDPLQRQDWYTPWIVETLKDLPPADVAPVRHGRWVPYSIEPEAFDIAGVKSWAKKYRCSECRFLHTVIEDFGIYTFCPNCGAKMDGDADD